MQVLRYDMSRFQTAFARARTTEVLGYGGYGGGKTYALCVRLIQRAVSPGAREGLCRRHLVTLKATTLRTLLDGDGDTPPVLPGGTYRHNKAEKIIRIRNGGEIVYFGVDSSEKIGGLNLTGCAVDQAEELTADQWMKLVGRTRVRHVEGNQRYAVCNPGPPTHHLAIRFGVIRDGAPGRTAVHLPTLENTYTTPEYRDGLNATSGVWRDRYVLGKWVAAEGLVYDNWDRNTMVGVRLREDAAVILGVDDAIANPCAVLVGWVYPSGHLHIAAMRYVRGLAESARVGVIASLGGREAEAVVIDPAARSLIEACRNEGIHAVKADHDVRPGISRVHGLIGQGLLTIDPGCKELLDEMDAYQWAKSGDGLRDAPVKKDDHACDALRYLVSHIVGISRRSLCAPVAVAEPKTRQQMRDENPDFGFEDQGGW